MSLFVTGTDTDVGKTVVSAVLLARYGRRVAYWKPVASGVDPTGATRSDRQDVARWAGHPHRCHPEAYTFVPPVSPHLAARHAGVVIEPDTLLATWRHHRDAGAPVVVEGVGGALVPLDDRGTLLVDLIAALRLPCLVVARASLGTINHSLLTLEALRARGVAVAGVVMNGSPDSENRRAVAQLGDVDVIELPPIDPLDATNLRAAAQRFDPRGLLAPHLATS